MLSSVGLWMLGQVFNPFWYPLVSELLGARSMHGEGGVCLLYACVMVAEGTSRSSGTIDRLCMILLRNDGGL